MYQIKVSGIDNNSDKSIWLNINDDNLNIYNENIKFIRKNPDYDICEKLELEDKTSQNELIMNEESLVNEINELSINPKFNKDQLKVKTLLEEKINTNEILVITGVAGAGKTYTILNIFEILDDLKDKSIVFSAPTNNVVQNLLVYKDILEKCFKKIDFCTTSVLLGEKCYFDSNGTKDFKIVEKKSNKIFNYDIVVIDEVSMVKNAHINYIKENKHKIGLCILLGDKNQLNPIDVTNNEINILDTYNINLTRNMRCENANIQEILNYIIYNIENFNGDFNSFIRNLNDIIYKNKNDDIYIVHNKEELIKLYLDLYKNSTTIIGNYRNEECIKLNNSIKKNIIENNNINVIDDYFIGLQLVFLEPYEEWNTSEFATIQDIKTTNFKFTDLNVKNLIENSTNMGYIKIDKYYGQLKNYNEPQYYDYFSISDKLYKYQKVINYLIDLTNTQSIINTIFNYINLFNNMEINILTLQKKNNIKVLKKNHIQNYNSLLNKVKKEINKLNDLINKTTYSSKNLYNDLIIQNLYTLLNKYRIEVFAQIECGFSCTIHRLQGCTIDNIIVNVWDIFRMNEEKNKLKCLYTCFSRCKNKLVIYIPQNPLCKCNKFTTQMYDKDKIDEEAEFKDKIFETESPG